MIFIGLAFGFDAHGFVPALFQPDLTDPLRLVRPDIPYELTWSAGGIFEYAAAPLVMVTESADGTQTRTAALDSLVAMNLSGGFSMRGLARFELAAPVFLTSTGLDGGNGFDMGDLRVAALVAPLRGNVLDAGVQVWLGLPTGQSEVFLGAGGVTAGGVLAASALFGPVALTGNLGMGYAPKGELNLENNSGLTLGLGANYQALDILAFGLESNMAAPFKNSGQTSSRVPAELTFTTRYGINENVLLLGGFAAGLSGGASAADWRGFLGASYGVVKAESSKPEPAVNADSDGDGLADAQDSCPSEKETFNGYKDEDGCPDGKPQATITVVQGGKPVEGATVQVKGGSSFSSTASGTRLEVSPGSSYTVSARLGCMAGELTATAAEGDQSFAVPLNPVLDASVAVTVLDEKGSLLPGAKLKWTSLDGGLCVPAAGAPGTVRVAAGRYRVLAQASGRLDQSAEVTVGANGSASISLTLKPAQVIFEGDKIRILQQVNFAPNKATILSSSYALLDQVIAMLEAHPEVLLIEIQGHTDDVGDDGANQVLSEARANAVAEYLIEHGIDPERIVARGYGETKPLLTPFTESNRAFNRRVEFVVLKK